MPGNTSSSPVPDSVIELIANDERLAAILERVKDNSDQAHDLSHILRVAKWAMAIAPPTIEKSELLAAVFLHDPHSRGDDYANQSHHSDRAAYLAQPLLQQVGFTSEAVDRILDAIRTHSYSRNLKPHSPIGYALQDADRLDALGAIGIFRLVTCAENYGSKYYNLADPWAESRDLSDRQYALDHFLKKLVNLVDTFHLPLAIEEAKSRTRFMQAFLEQLRHEITQDVPGMRTTLAAQARSEGDHNISSVALPCEAKEIVFSSPNSIAIRTFALPARKPNKIRVKTKLSAISHGTELNMLRGLSAGFSRSWNPDLRLFNPSHAHKSFPVCPGYETVGEIIETDDIAAGELREGALIWLDAPHRTIHDIDLDQARAGLLPDGLTPARGVFLALTRVGLGALHDAHIKVGDNVCVVGLGTIGMIIAQLARHAGASTVFAIDTSSFRCSVARRFGITAIEYQNADTLGYMKELSGPYGFDAIFEASGTYSGLHTAIAIAPLNGCVTCISSYHGTAENLRLGDEFHRNRITLLSSMTVNGAFHRDHPHWDLRRLNSQSMAILRAGAIDVESLISHKVSFADAERAYALAADFNTSMKVVLTYEA